VSLCKEEGWGVRARSDGGGHQRGVVSRRLRRDAPRQFHVLTHAVGGDLCRRSVCTRHRRSVSSCKTVPQCGNARPCPPAGTLGAPPCCGSCCWRKQQTRACATAPQPSSPSSKPARTAAPDARHTARGTHPVPVKLSFALGSVSGSHTSCFNGQSCFLARTRVCLRCWCPEPGDSGGDTHRVQ